MAKPDMTLRQIMNACPPGAQVEIYSEVDNPGPDDELWWRVRLPGRGVYMGLALKDGKGNLLMAERPHTFIPETVGYRSSK